MRKISAESAEEIIRLYKFEYVPMKEIAERYGVTRMGIWKILNRCGIDTTKEAAHIASVCHQCNTPITVIRSVIRNRAHVFCSYKCYWAWLNRSANPFLPNRTGGRNARKIVSQYYPLQEGYVVHHEDRNQKNNAIWNLMVFRCQADHLRYHRGFNTLPIWDGSKVALKPREAA